jgi:carbamoyl-phosphate synthase large subunit
LDLRLLAQHREAFERLGCRVLVSRPDVIDICQDKRETHHFLRQHGFATPAVWTVPQVLAADRRKRFAWPCFLKPWDGHAGKGTAVVRDRQELLCLSKRVPHAICQELIEAVEFTCDVYIDFEMRVRCVVPRQRLEVRSGEVSKARIVKHPRIMEEAVRLVELLEAGPGVVTLQMFETLAGEIKVIEINPRFGGGVPLSIRAGADFPKWILQELAGKRPCIRPDAFEDGLTMLRYDAEVWVTDAPAKGVKVQRVKA